MSSSPVPLSNPPKELRITLFSREGCQPCRTVKPAFEKLKLTMTESKRYSNVAFEVVELTADGDDDDDDEQNIDASVTVFPVLALTHARPHPSGGGRSVRAVLRDANGQPVSALMGGGAILKNMADWTSKTVASHLRPAFSLDADF